MHRAAKTAVKAGVLGEDLGQRSVDQEVDGHVLRRFALAFVEFGYRLVGDTAEKAFHHGDELGFAEFVDRREALGENLAVAAVRPENEVLGRQQVSLSDRGGFLPHRQVRRAGIVVLDAVVGVGRLDRVQHRFELADEAHVAVDAQEVVLAVVRLFFLDRALVLVDRDFAELDVAGAPHFLRADVQLLGHFGCL